ncbi:MAG TPA: phospholipid carrier-dependent glycosyltransferase [Candidatus Binatia bacterium]|nr:phospholipid carrier-dependent glycosyltransferase [Candidatus Binatia bacterium]
MLILAFALCAASGYLLIAAALPREKTSSADSLMRLSLAPGFGLGIFSAVFFLMRLFGATHFIAVDLSVLVLLALTFWLRGSRRAQACTPALENADISATAWVRRVLGASFVVAILALLYNAVVRILAHPHGDGWDAFAIWNLHARFLFLGGANWRDGFNAIIPWSHPDYPLLLPAAIAHIWSYLGHDDPLVPAIIGLIFTISTVGLLVSALMLLRGLNSAMLGGLALSSTPFFVEQGTSQYADVPLSFFILASLVVLHKAYGHADNREPPKSGPLMLSGLAAAFAAWTKNEGLLFFSALIVAQIWILKRGPRHQSSTPRSGRNWTSLVFLLLGAIPVLAVIAWFKHSVATPGDLFSSWAIMLDKILTPARYGIIVQWLAKEFLRFGSWWLIPGTIALLAFWVFTFRKLPPERSHVFQIAVFTLALTFAGYFAVYLVTPRDLYWHLRFSLNRLFLQFWPSAIFLFFLRSSPQTSPATEPE